MGALPDLSRFELQCLRILWGLGEGTIRNIVEELPDPPTYSTVKKIVERLEEKGAVERRGKREKAWIYRSTVSAPAMIHREIRRFLDILFEGGGRALVSHLADMDEVSLAELKEIEARVALRPEGGGRKEGAKE